VPGNRVVVGKATMELLENPDFEEWEDDELIRGQRRAVDGTWKGRRPKVVPLGLLYELNRRVASRGAKKLMAGLDDAIDYLVNVARGLIPPDKDRIHAAEVVINRVLGATPQKVELKTMEPSVWEKQGVTKAVVVRDVIDVDSEEWHNPFEEEG
jgi:hypothetical protein